MRGLRRVLLVLAGLLCAADACSAQNLSLIWSEWETSAVQRQGPQQADGIFLYFHGRSSRDVTGNPILSIFIEMANVANWDILRINRHPFADCEESDDDILQVVADRVRRARDDGYKKVVVGGGSGGGWLALRAATLPGVDAAIGLAPGTAYGRYDLIRTRDILAEDLTRAGAKRIAIFFFEGDLLERLEERRSVAIRRSLEKSGASYVIVDHPPDLLGHQAMGSGRLVRRYRDCLLQFVRDVELPVGEFLCSLAAGYAAGSDIGFPDIAAPLKVSVDANPALLPYVGRWQGDDEWGAYLILEAVAIESNIIEFEAGWSEAVGSGRPTVKGGYPFEFDEKDGSILYRPNGSRSKLTARLKSSNELEVAFHIPDHNGQVATRRILLHRRGRDR
jgi:pimeloyl-ACP methyl ester carboxylesterase